MSGLSWGPGGARAGPARAGACRLGCEGAGTLRCGERDPCSTSHGRLAAWGAGVREGPGPWCHQVRHLPQPRQPRPGLHASVLHHSW